MLNRSRDASAGDECGEGRALLVHHGRSQELDGDVLRRKNDRGVRARLRPSRPCDLPKPIQSARAGGTSVWRRQQAPPRPAGNPAWSRFRPRRSAPSCTAAAQQAPRAQSFGRIACHRGATLRTIAGCLQVFFAFRNAISSWLQPHQGVVARMIDGNTKRTKRTVRIRKKCRK